MIAEPSSFEVFLNYAYPITQMSYWVVLSISAIVAVLLFKRFVDAQAGTAAEKDVSIDEFVD